MIDTIQADVMLLGWSETHNGGAKITLQLADIAQLEPFKKMTLKKGKVAGQLMTAVFVEVDGNGQPVPPEPEPGTGEQAAKKRAQLRTLPDPFKRTKRIGGRHVGVSAVDFEKALAAHRE